MRHYVGGQCALMPELTALYSPTINAYRRYVPGVWAPMSATWGVENRTTAIRIIGVGTPATRVEYRQTAADINPYIAMATCLAAGLYGIEHEIEPPPAKFAATRETEPAQRRGAPTDSLNALRRHRGPQAEQGGARDPGRRLRGSLCTHAGMGGAAVRARRHRLGAKAILRGGVIMATTWSFPTRILFGVGSVGETGAEARRVSATRALIVTDKGVAAAGLVDPARQSLEAAGIAVAIFDGVMGNPVEKNVRDGIAAFRDAKADVVIAIGGGSPLDVGKLVRLGIHHQRPLVDYDDATGGDQYITANVPPMIAIPTTAGTGSEVGRSGVVTLDVNHRKTVIFSPHLLANAAILDPAMTRTMPPHITAATGFDALTHCLEAYVAKGDHPMADGIAMEGLRLIAANLERAVLHGGGSRGARRDALKASMMGAVAFQKGPRGVSFAGASALQRVRPAPWLGQRVGAPGSGGVERRGGGRAVGTRLRGARRRAFGERLHRRTAASPSGDWPAQGPRGGAGSARQIGAPRRPGVRGRMPSAEPAPLLPRRSAPALRSLVRLDRTRREKIRIALKSASNEAVATRIDVRSEASYALRTIVKKRISRLPGATKILPRLGVRAALV